MRRGPDADVIRTAMLCSFGQTSCFIENQYLLKTCNRFNSLMPNYAYMFCYRLSIIISEANDQGVSDIYIHFSEVNMLVYHIGIVAALTNYTVMLFWITYVQCTWVIGIAPVSIFVCGYIFPFVQMGHFWKICQTTRLWISKYIKKSAIILTHVLASIMVLHLWYEWVIAPPPKKNNECHHVPPS